jgi:hypothetical protein
MNRWCLEENEHELKYVEIGVKADAAGANILNESNCYD